MNEKSGSCCSCGSDCCKPESKPAKKKIAIDFLYLDLSTCERCQGTEDSLDRSIDEVSAVLKAAGFQVEVNKVNITSEKLAEEYRFVSSPTIRVNGRDIAGELKENCCEDCGDLCGDDVECRVWVYEGKDYNVPPKGLIINAILKEAYSDLQIADLNPSNNEYELPDNLKKFFDGLENNK